MVMYINKRKDTVFIVNLKCGYSTFEHLVKKGIVKRYIGPIRHKYKIMIARDPYKRLESFYKAKLHKGIRTPIRQHCQKQLLKYVEKQRFLNKQISFQEFMVIVMHGYRDEHIEPQTNIMPPFVNKVVRLEDGFKLFDKISRTSRG